MPSPSSSSSKGGEDVKWSSPSSPSPSKDEGSGSWRFGSSTSCMISVEISLSLIPWLASALRVCLALLPPLPCPQKKPQKLETERQPTNQARGRGGGGNDLTFTVCSVVFLLPPAPASWLLLPVSFRPAFASVEARPTPSAVESKENRPRNPPASHFSLTYHRSSTSEPSLTGTPSSCT